VSRIALAFLIAPAATSPACAAHWNVDAAKSTLGFTVIWNKQPFTATFKSWKADIAFDPADLAHSRVVATIDTGSETSDDSETDDGVRGAVGFAASQFPTAKFEATNFTHGSGSAYSASGTLTIKGDTRPVTLDFNLNVTGDTAIVVGKARLMRTDFGLGTTQEWAGDTPVAHQVVVTLNLRATKPH
jgi:cytochrome b561